MSEIPMTWATAAEAGLPVGEVPLRFVDDEEEPRRVMTAAEILERERLNVENTTERLRARVTGRRSVRYAPSDPVVGKT